MLLCSQANINLYARMSNIALSAMAALSYPETYHLVIIMGGINDLSKLVYAPTKHALPRYGNLYDQINLTLDSFRESIGKIRKITEVPVILATLAGMELAKYSPSYAALLQPLQSDFNKAIIEINKQIRGINRLVNLDTINLAYPVHRCKGGGGRYTTQFSLLYDGLHPSEQLLSKWADMVIEFCTGQFPHLCYVQPRVNHSTVGPYVCPSVSSPPSHSVHYFASYSPTVYQHQH